MIRDIFGKNVISLPGGLMIGVEEVGSSTWVSIMIPDQKWHLFSLSEVDRQRLAKFIASGEID